MTQLIAGNISKRFSGLSALNAVSVRIKDGEIHGLIGPNGAGKSTLFKIISGFLPPDEGDIVFNGKNIRDKKPSDIARLGIVRTFQETTLFQELSVLQNVLVGCHLQTECSVIHAVLGGDKIRRRRALERSLEILEFVNLGTRKDQLAAQLPLGSQRALSIAVALATQPSLILMDEPFAGMNPEETRKMMALTRKIQESGITIALVEHDMKAVMGLCEYLTVLNFGSILAQGTPSEIRKNSLVIDAYLGGRENVF